MFDFLRVSKVWDSKQHRYVYSPSFIIKSTIKDLMIRQRDFYAIYDEETGLWEQNESRAIELIDAQIRAYAAKDAGDAMSDTEHGPIVKTISNTDNRLIGKWHTYCQRDMRDNATALNQKVIFSNQTPARKDYATKKLSYPLLEQDIPAYDTMCDCWYDTEQRQKFEWLAGCGLCGEGKLIQKALLFYGDPGTGKSSIVKDVICEGVFEGKKGFSNTFDATNLATGGDGFGTAFLADDPVISYDPDAQLTMINARGTINKIISHESVRVNAKFKSDFFTEPNTLLMICSNDPIQISPNSGIKRRIIDVRPTGNTLPADIYDWCISQIPFEKSGIAYRCIQTYKKLGRHYYDHYVAEDMLNRTSPFHNFVTENYDLLKDGISLAAAYDIYTKYAEESNFKNILVRYKFRDTLKLYYKDYDKGHYKNFRPEKIGLVPITQEEVPDDISEKSSTWLHLDNTVSLFDEMFKDAPAQYETDDPDYPLRYSWDDCKTKLSDLDTRRIHYVRVPIWLIVLDFDIRGEDGQKSLELNLKEASKFPPTYAELSKSGSGIHLHYIYKGGDPEELSSLYSPNVEIKVFKGKSPLRRKLTYCNDIPIAELSSGLPLKEEMKMVDGVGFENEAKLIAVIKKASTVEKLPGGGKRVGFWKKNVVSTSQNIDLIGHCLNEAYASGKTYDVRDLVDRVTSFARQSTNHAQQCFNKVSKMLWCSKDILDGEHIENFETDEHKEKPLTVFDIEIAPSYRQALKRGEDVSDIPKDTEALFLICWMIDGSNQVHHEFNPTPSWCRHFWEEHRIMGYNNKAYDNHMVYKRALGYTSEELYDYNKRLINKNKQISKNSKDPKAYNISWTDIKDYLGTKDSLKQWEIEMEKKGIPVNHKEWGYSFDMPVPKDKWDEFASYCENDVLATDALFNFTHGQYLAREMFARLAHGTPNDSTNKLTDKYIKGDADHIELVYTDFTTGKQYGDGVPFTLEPIDYDTYISLGDDWTGVEPVNTNHFPGYHWVRFPDGSLHNMFRGVDMGKGGYVYNNPGMYFRAVTRDSASHHPSSIEALNLFGKQTPRYSRLKTGRYALKHNEIEKAKVIFDGELDDFFKDEDDVESVVETLQASFKLGLNSTYGQTSSTNGYFEIEDKRNVNNIVALRGAMVLKIIQDEVEARGFTVIHIKTDSIKIADPTDDILNLVDEIGKHYGYTFETEHTWSRICLVDKAQFIGLHDVDDPKSPLIWEATGAAFKVPYIFKNLFSHEKVTFSDLSKTINVKKGTLHLVYPDGSDIFIGRVGLFCPMKTKGGTLLCYREDKNGELQKVAASGTKNILWMEAETVKALHLEEDIDMSYWNKQCDDAIDTINKFGDFERFVTVD